MAKIKYDDLFDSNLDDEIKSLKAVIRALIKANEQLANSYKPAKKATDELTESTKKLNGATKAGRKQNKDNAKEASEMAEKVLLAKKATEEYAKILKKGNNAMTIALANQKALNASIAATDGTTKKGIKTLETLNKARQKNIDVLTKLNKQFKEEKNNVDGLNGSYNNLQKRQKENVAEWKKMSRAQRENTTEGKKMTAQIRKQEAELKKLDSTIGRSFRNVGNYSSALKGARTSLIGIAAGAGIATSATLLIGQTIANASKLVVNFQKDQSTLAGVLGKSRKEITELTQSAKDLGITTIKTASEVTKLQIVLARLGFTETEILGLQAGIINSSIALNSQLDETAALVGAIVRTFNDFTALDTAEIVDTLTVATQKSALNFERLRTSIPIVAGAANAAGIPFNKMVALLGKLADSGIDASMSATSLRNIFIDAKKEGLNFEQILRKISVSTDKLTAANDAFGRRTAISASVLAENLGLIGELETKLDNAGGATQKLVDENMTTLAAKLKELKSAWEGLILSFESGDGAFGGLAGSLIELSTSLLRAAGEPFKGYIGKMKSLTAQLEDVGKNAKEATHKLIDLGDKGLITKKVEELTTELELASGAVKFLEEEARESAGGFDNYADAKVEVAFLEAQILLLTGATKKLTTEQEINEEQLRLSALQAVALAEALKEIRKFNEGSNAITSEDFAKEVVKGFDKMIAKADEMNALSEEISQFDDSDLNFLWAEEDAEALGDATKEADKYKDSLEGVKEKNAELLEAGVALASGLSDTFTSLNDLRNAQIEQELQTVLAARDAEIAAANGNADEIALIQEKFKKKSDELNLEKAKNDKQSAIFEALINTAVGVTTALASANPILAAVIGALGAVQVGVIASTPLPAFEKGTDFAPGGAAIVGEKGTEMVITPSGEVALTPDKASVVDLERGSTVLTAQETIAALNNFNDGARDLTAPNVIVQGLTRGDLDKQTKALSEAFENQTQMVAHFTKDGVETFMKHKGGKTKYYNNRYN